MLYFIPTPIGNLEDISQRSLRLLASLPLLFCEDTRVTRRLLKLIKERYNLEITQKRFISLHSHNEHKILENLDPTIFTEDCAYVSDAGMPCISDPGAALAKYCQLKKIDYEVIPGANAALLAYAASGFSNPRFTFWGFLPPKEKALKDDLSIILNHQNPTIIYEAPHRILKTVETLAFLAPERHIFLLKEATKKHETSFFGTASHVKENLLHTNLKGEWVIVVNESLSQRNFEFLSIEDILPLSLPPKEKSKLLAKLTGQSVKFWYSKLLNSSI